MPESVVLDDVRHGIHRLHDAMSKSHILKHDCTGLVRACYKILFLFEDAEDWLVGLNTQHGTGYTESRFAKITENQQFAAALLEKCGEFNLAAVTVLAGVLQAQLCSLKWKLSRAFSDFPYESKMQAKYEVVRSKLDKETFPLLKKLQDESSKVAVLVHSLCVKRNQFTQLGPKDWQRHWHDILSASAIPTSGIAVSTGFEADCEVVLRCISAELSELSASLRFNPHHQQYLHEVLHLLGGSHVDVAASTCSAGSVQSAPKTPDRTTPDATLQPAGSFSSTGSAPEPTEHSMQVTTPVQTAAPQADMFSPGSAASITHESKQSRESLPLMTPQAVHNSPLPAPGSHASMPSSVGSVGSNRPPAVNSSLAIPCRILQLSDLLMKSPQAVPLTAASPVGHSSFTVPHQSLDMNERDDAKADELVPRTSPLTLPKTKPSTTSGTAGDCSDRLVGLDVSSISKATQQRNKARDAAGVEEKDALNREDDGEDSYDGLSEQEGMFDFEHTLLPLPPLPVSRSQDEALRVMAQSVVAQRPRTRSSTSVLPSPAPSSTTEFFTPAPMAYPKPQVPSVTNPTPVEPQQESAKVEAAPQQPAVVDESFYIPQDPSERVASWLHSVDLEQLPESRHPARGDKQTQGKNPTACDAPNPPATSFYSPAKALAAPAQTQTSSPTQPAVQPSSRIMFLTPVAAASPDDSKGTKMPTDALPFLTPLPKGQYSARGVVAKPASTPPPLQVASPVQPKHSISPSPAKPNLAAPSRDSLDAHRDVDSSIVEDTSIVTVSTATPHMPPGVRQSAPLLASILTSPRLHNIHATAGVRESMDTASAVSPRPKHHLRDRLRSMLTSGKNRGSKILHGWQASDKSEPPAPVTAVAVNAETKHRNQIAAAAPVNAVPPAADKVQPSISTLAAVTPEEHRQMPPRAGAMMEVNGTPRHATASGANAANIGGTKPKSSFIQQKLPSAISVSKSGTSATFQGKKSVSFANDGQAVPFPPKQLIANTDLMNAETMATVTHTLHQMNFTVKTAARRKLDGRSALHEAVSTNKEWMVKMMLQTSFLPVDVVSETGRTPLHEAVIVDSLPITRLLLSHGASVDAKDQDMVTPMHLVRSAAMAEVLLATKPRMNVPVMRQVEGSDELVRGTTALHAVVSRGSTQSDTHAWGSIVSNMVKSGADVNALDQNGCTPLHLAAANGCISLVRVLIENGADASLLDQDNKAALELAKNQEGKKVAEPVRSSKTAARRKRSDCSVQ